MHKLKDEFEHASQELREAKQTSFGRSIEIGRLQKQIDE